LEAGQDIVLVDAAAAELVLELMDVMTLVTLEPGADEAAAEVINVVETVDVMDAADDEIEVFDDDTGVGARMADSADATPLTIGVYPMLAQVFPVHLV